MSTATAITDRPSLGTCPKCKTGQIRRTPKGWGCSRYKADSDPCNFSIWRSSFGHSLSDDEARELVASGVTTNAVTLQKRDGSGSYTAALRINDEFRVVPALYGSPDAKVLGICPICKQGGVTATPKGWGCSRHKETGCDFTIWGTIRGHRVTPDEAGELVNGGMTASPAAFTNRQGQTFEARLRLDERSRVALVFDGAPELPADLA